MLTMAKAKRSSDDVPIFSLPTQQLDGIKWENISLEVSESACAYEVSAMTWS